MKMLIAICATCLLLATPSFGQDAPVLVSDNDLQLIRSDLQASRSTIIANTMQFTEQESTAFWPIYRDYTRDQQRIGDKLVQLVKEYAQNYDTLTDTQAKDMTQRLINIQDETLNLKEDYWKQFESALGAKRAAKFYQVDHRLSIFINLQLTDQIPLIP